MKKKITLVATSVLLVAAMVIGGTLAYFTDTDKATNTFTMGNVDITLDEALVNKTGDEWIADAQAPRVQANEYEGVYPGAVMPKDPTVHVADGSDAFVRVKVTIENGLNWMGLYGDTNPGAESNFVALINDTLGEGWEIADIELKLSFGDQKTSDVIVTLNHTAKVEAGTSTVPAFTHIAIPGTMTGSDITTRISQDGTFDITVIAEAIQADGFDTVKEAFAAYDAEA